MSTHLRNGSDGGWVVMTRADERRQVWNQYWDTSGDTVNDYARPQWADEELVAGVPAPGQSRPQSGPGLRGKREVARSEADQACGGEQCRDGDQGEEGCGRDVGCRSRRHVGEG